MAVTDAIRLERKLGEGGMGTVWLARHARLEADVVVKFLGPGTAHDPAAAARFANEAATVARVRSPHIVQVLDFGTTADDQPFIVMELLEGEDLHARLKREAKLSLSETVRIVTQIAKGLARAHERGIVHRDIKPANVFLCDVGAPRAETFVKVLDFGIAKTSAGSEQADLRTASGVVVGTPAYMSPEQLVGSRDVDAKSDLWALAALTFRALTGVPPFRGDSVAGLALAIHQGTRPSACELEATLPPAIEAFFERAFHRDRDERFASAAEMSAALMLAATATDADAARTAVTKDETGPPAPRVPQRRSGIARFGLVAIAFAIAFAIAAAVIAFASRTNGPPSPIAAGSSPPLPGSIATIVPIGSLPSVASIPSVPPVQLDGAAPSGPRARPQRTPWVAASQAPAKERDIE